MAHVALVGRHQLGGAERLLIAHERKGMGAHAILVLSVALDRHLSNRLCVDGQAPVHPQNQ